MIATATNLQLFQEFVSESPRLLNSNISWNFLKEIPISEVAVLFDFWNQALEFNKINEV